ncbi:hypothetical protein HK099_003237 [Clydaea vesicula]|uniref:N-acetyltransferase domain-containing protein n=1 Tax=Clydaea vesicula TaxID=447962 RepID=A0AAD5U1V2_9FUNG|nr:hypothetical protein HK099_003237 [Clydaea vesicula]
MCNQTINLLTADSDTEQLKQIFDFSTKLFNEIGVNLTKNSTTGSFQFWLDRLNKQSGKIYVSYNEGEKKDIQGFMFVYKKHGDNMHIWIAATNPLYRRKHVMTYLLKTVQDAELKNIEPPLQSIKLTVNTYPEIFPGMVKFLEKELFNRYDEVNETGASNFEILGSYACGLLRPEQLEKVIKDLKSLTSKPLNINLQLPRPNLQAEKVNRLSELELNDILVEIRKKLLITAPKEISSQSNFLKHLKMIE